MSRIDQILCWLGFHVIDLSDIHRRRMRAARMGVDLAAGLPCHCTRCGRSIWR